VAVTVKVEDVPAVTDVGLAAMLTVAGGSLTTFIAPLFTPQPVRARDRKRAVLSAGEKTKLPPMRWAVSCFKDFLLSPFGDVVGGAV
jgi:hypothetical protein